MKSNYKPIGNYVKQVKLKNTDNSLTVEHLRGIRINKEFMPSVANVTGTDLSKYRVVKRYQFAYNPMHVGRDEILPISMLADEEAIIVSPAYVIFEIIDTNELLPEYLMIWCRRSEFDRNAWFTTDSSVRGGFSWDDFCGLELPVPSIDKQKEIVKEYKTITDRIKLNEQLNQKLEETAQAIYKEWFVDFEFPDVYGKPYKSSGGKMVYCDELDMEIPEGWKFERLKNLIESASKKHYFNQDELIFFNTSDILNGEFLHNNYSLVDKMPGQAKKSIQKLDILYSEIRPENKRFALVRVDNTDDYVVSTKLMVLRRISDKIHVYKLYYFLTSKDFISILQHSAYGRSGTFPQITYDLDIANKNILFACDIIEQKWSKFLESYYNQLFSRKDEIKLLHTMKELILSKMATIKD